MVLHECLRGTTPFEAETRLTFIAHKLDTGAVAESPPVLVLAAAAPALDTIIARMMTPVVDARPHSAGALYETLSRLD